MVKRIFKYLGIGILLLLTAMLVNTLLQSKPEFDKPTVNTQDLLKDGFLRYSESIRFRVIGHDDAATNIEQNKSELQRFHAWMRKSYPILSKTARWETINGGSLLITIKGKNNGPAAMFLGHLDVVPADDSTLWKYPPFEGKITGDTLWGRGTLDDKNAVIALLEAAERMLAKGQQPKNSIILAFGQDEETGGAAGAAHIQKYLLNNKIPISFIADEGFGVMKGIVPGLANDCAIIGLAEKGNLTLKLSVEIPGGHSAWPHPENTTSVLANALSKIEHYQFPAKLEGPVKGLFAESAPYMNFGYKFLFSNLTITAPLVKNVLTNGVKTAASIRTTHVTTVIQAGSKENVVPPAAQALINFRTVPNHSSEEIIEQIKSLVNDDRIQISIFQGAIESSPISPSEGIGINEIKKAIHATFPKTVAVPGLVITGTDCKNYTKLTPRIYRFVPYTFSNHNLSGIHGRNEYVTIQQFTAAVGYYEYLFGLL